MFDPLHHPLLGAEARALAVAALEAQARLAEDLLGLSPDAFDALAAPEQRAWAEAVALQINYHLDRVEARVAEAAADFRASYRPGVVSPAASALVAACLAGCPGVDAGPTFGVLGPAPDA